MDVVEISPQDLADYAARGVANLLVPCITDAQGNLIVVDEEMYQRAVAVERAKLN